MTREKKNNTEESVSLCTLRAGEEAFGMETCAVREALSHCALRNVPLAPWFVAGVMAYRGEVLAAISLRALLGLAPSEAASCAMVLQDGESGELFALLLDELLDVVQVAESEWEPNPPTLDEKRGLLFSGVYRTASAPLVRLKQEHVAPSWLMQNGGAATARGNRP